VSTLVSQHTLMWRPCLPGHRVGLITGLPALLDEGTRHCFMGSGAIATIDISMQHRARGDQILRRWCTEVLPSPTSRTAAAGTAGTATAVPLSNHWVYTSNVDGHFGRAGFVKESVLELHGSCTGRSGWFCQACAVAAPTDDIHKQQDGVDRQNRISRASTAPPPGYRFAVDPKTMTVPDNDSGSSTGFGTGWPRCTQPACGGLLRPAVHMFSEDSSVLLETLREEEQRYVAWECQMEIASALRLTVVAVSNKQTALIGAQD
jgi:hypothetical protein